MTQANDDQIDGDGFGLVDEERRRALVRMGRFAGLTAPAIITLVTADASEVWAQSLLGSPGGKPPGPPGGKPPRPPGRNPPGRPGRNPPGLQKP